MSAAKKLILLTMCSLVLVLIYAFASLWLVSRQLVVSIGKDLSCIELVNNTFDFQPFYNARMREICVNDWRTKWMGILPYYQSIAVLNMLAWMDDDLRGCLISKYTPFVGRSGEQFIGLDAAAVHWFERQLDKLTDEEMKFIKSKMWGRSGPKK